MTDAVKEPTPEIACSFCGKAQREVRKLIAGPTAYVCDECIKLCNDLIAEEERERAKAPPVKRENERAAIEFVLRERVVGHAEALSLCAGALHAQEAAADGAPVMNPPRVLLVGPRGAGRTTLGLALCAATALPAVALDASLADVGEVTLRPLARRLYESDEGGAERASRGVVFVDGLEKLARGTDDRAAPSARRLLVAMLDGVEIDLMIAQRPGASHGGVTLATDALWVVAAMRVPREALAACASERELRAAVRDLGLPEELMARFDRVVPLHALGAGECHELLVRPKGLVEQAVATVAALGASLEFAPPAIAHMAALAADEPDGAWALRRWVHRLVAGAARGATARVDEADVDRVAR